MAGLHSLLLGSRTAYISRCKQSIHTISSTAAAGEILQQQSTLLLWVCYVAFYNICKKMNVIAKISCYLDCSVVTLKLRNMLGSSCNLKTHVQNLGYPLPLQIGGPKTAFLGLLCNLTAILMAYIFGKKHDIDNRSSALTTTRGLLHRPKMS